MQDDLDRRRQAIWRSGEIWRDMARYGEIWRDGAWPLGLVARLTSVTRRLLLAKQNVSSLSIQIALQMIFDGIRPVTGIPRFRPASTQTPGFLPSECPHMQIK